MVDLILLVNYVAMIVGYQTLHPSLPSAQNWQTYMRNIRITISSSSISTARTSSPFSSNASLGSTPSAPPPAATLLMSLSLLSLATCERASANSSSSSARGGRSRHENAAGQRGKRYPAPIIVLYCTVLPKRNGSRLIPKEYISQTPGESNSFTFCGTYRYYSMRARSCGVY